MEKVPAVIKDLAFKVQPNTLLAVGFPLLTPGGQLYNAAALLGENQVLGIVLKQQLARSGIHYETRWFTPWPPGVTTVIDFAGEQIMAGELGFEDSGVRIGFENYEG